MKQWWWWFKQSKQWWWWFKEGTYWRWWFKQVKWWLFQSFSLLLLLFSDDTRMSRMSWMFSPELFNPYFLHIFCKRALLSVHLLRKWVALLRKETYNSRHPMHFRHHLVLSSAWYPYFSQKSPVISGSFAEISGSFGGIDLQLTKLRHPMFFATNYSAISCWIFVFFSLKYFDCCWALVFTSRVCWWY